MVGNGCRVFNPSLFSVSLAPCQHVHFFFLAFPVQKLSPLSALLPLSVSVFICIASCGSLRSLAPQKARFCVSFSPPQKAVALCLTVSLLLVSVPQKARNRPKRRFMQCVSSAPPKAHACPKRHAVVRAPARPTPHCRSRPKRRKLCFTHLIFCTVAFMQINNVVALVKKSASHRYGMKTPLFHCWFGLLHNLQTCSRPVRRPSGRLGALFHVKLFARLGAFGGVWGRGVSVRVASVSIPFTLRRFGERSDFIQPGYLQ